MCERNILITGATGTVGRELVAELLRRDPKARPILLIRAADDRETSGRMQKIQRYLGTVRPGIDLSRTRAVRGDITLPHLGLDPATAERLQASVTEIVHAAASVQLDLPLACARQINVDGTSEVLRFATRCRRLRRLAHVSTAFVAGDRTGRVTENELERDQGYLNAYEQSKCEAEALVRAHADRLPITIFRPSIVVGDSADGHIATFGTIYQPVRRIASGRIRAIPGDPDLHLDLVPIDYVVRMIACLLENPRSVGRTYHLTAGRENAIAVGRLLEEAIRLLEGPALPPLDFTTAGPPPAHHSRLAPFFAYLSREKDFDATQLQQDLGPDAPRPPRAESYLDRLFAFCRETRWGAGLPWEDGRCLAMPTH
jgi:long-chain acyl-CoA synthetase